MHSSRNFTRHPVALKVGLFAAGHWQDFVTGDVSRKGLFVRMASPAFKENQVIQIKVELPSGTVLLSFAVVRRVISSQLQSPTGTGLGLEFYGIAAEMQATWDAFVLTLRAKRISEGFSESSQNLRDQLPPPHVREMLKKMREAGEIVEAPLLSTRGTIELRPVVVEVAPASVDRLTAFADRCAAGGSIFLRPKHRCEVGRRLHIVLIHPQTDEEFILHALAERMVTGEDGTYAGVQARFARLPPDQRAELTQFCTRRVQEIATGYGRGPDGPSRPIPRSELPLHLRKN